MSMPGFTAEASVYTIVNRYSGSAATSLSQTVTTKGNVRPAQTLVYVWSSVNERSCPSTQCDFIQSVDPGWVYDYCQTQGETVTAEGTTNSWWSNIGGGWISNIYIQGPAIIPGVPYC